MPLNLSVSDGDFTPYLKYNAKAGRFYAKPEGGDEVEILNPVLAFDMARIKTGWLYYAEGSGPEKIWDSSPEIAAPKPPGPKKFKRGFEVMVVGNMTIPGTDERLGLREFSSTAGNVITSILRMYAEYEAGLAANARSYPIYACTGVKPINGAYGTNYEPLFKLAKWAPQVPDFELHQPRADPISTSPQRMNGASGHHTDANYVPLERSLGGGNALDDDIPFAAEFR